MCAVRAPLLVRVLQHGVSAGVVRRDGVAVARGVRGELILDLPCWLRLPRLDRPAPAWTSVLGIGTGDQTLHAAVAPSRGGHIRVSLQSGGTQLDVAGKRCTHVSLPTAGKCMCTSILPVLHSSTILSSERGAGQ